MKQTTLAAVVISVLAIFTATPGALAQDATAEIAAAIKQATKENRHVLIEWTAPWCGWCTKLNECFKKDAKISRLLRWEYDIVHVDVGRFDKNLDLAAKYGAAFKEEGIPYLTILAGDGSVVANQETGSLEEGAKHDPTKVLAFLKKNQASPRTASSVRDAAIIKAKKEKKNVLLHFGAPWCGWCLRFEAWLAQPDTSAFMDSHFIEVKIDTDRDKGGEVMRKHYAQGRSTGIPWFVILSPEGKAITTSDGPNGNVGCPWTDEEITLFGTILAQSKSGVSAEEVAAMETSLKKFRTQTEKKKQ